ncbi:hypothetical protein ACJEI5_25240, partial [Escherichia coli]
AAIIGGTYYFVPQDVRYQNEATLRAGSLSEGRLKDLLKDIRAQKSMLLLDTCYAGAFVGRERLALNFRGLEEKTA